MHQPQQQQPITSSPRVVYSSQIMPGPIAPATAIPLATHLNGLANTLNDAPQDDVKFSALKEISENLEELFATPAYTALVENLIRIFMKLLHETVPQFIAENNTLQLRKLMLELLYRLSSNEAMKAYTKNLQQILLRLIYSENEDNALLIIKILTDHIKNFRPPFSSDLTTFFAQWKSAYTEMFRHTEQPAEMFLERPCMASNGNIDESVVEGLKTCYATTSLTYTSAQHPGGGAPVMIEATTAGQASCPTLDKYTLIPRANQSVKVLAEMSVFLMVLIQAHRQQLMVEMLDIVPIFVRYINIRLPRHVREEKPYNRELVDEFHNSQVRALTFIAYTAKQTQVAEQIANVGGQLDAMADGILMLLEDFHDELIGQRRDLIIAIKCLFQTDFKAKFVRIIPKLFDEKALLGASFTSQEQLRNQAYSSLADIIHHVRMSLGELLAPVFFMCSRNLHDQQLMPYVQTMFGKLMMNLIEPLLMQSRESDRGSELHREILCHAIDSFVRKARTIAQQLLPAIAERQRASAAAHAIAATATTATSSASASSEQQQKTAGASDQKSMASTSTSGTTATATAVTTEPGSSGQEKRAETTTAGTSTATTKSTTSTSATSATAFDWHESAAGQLVSMTDCKNMIRFTILPLKMMVIALRDFQQDADCLRMVEALLMDLFSHGLRCLDIFMLGTSAYQTALAAGGGGQYPPHQKYSSPTNIRSKEEKDTIEAFIAIFTNIDTAIFEKIMERHIELLIERISVNPVLWNICNAFFNNPQTMKKMVVVLVKFLLTKLPELGVNNDRASLYLKLFKLVFHAISTSSNNSDTDAILKPFLNGIVQDSMQLAISSRESTNYFILLRSLFRSIGTGTHDNLYQQFLPLLPSILQQLNRLQNGAHRQPIHELFVELCLTVPVRLSSLLPYLPLLMDPLVSALNGSPALVQQGLRTLELCVDNLNPDYFYDHMQPVRAALMKGLWRTVSAGDQQSALVALRILGKFGGSNRKVLLDAQTMDFVLPTTNGSDNLFRDNVPPKICFNFARMPRHQNQPASQQPKTEESSGGGSITGSAAPTPTASTSEDNNDNNGNGNGTSSSTTEQMVEQMSLEAAEPVEMEVEKQQQGERQEQQQISASSPSSAMMNSAAVSVEEPIRTAVAVLRSQNVADSFSSQAPSAAQKVQAAEFIKAVLMAQIPAIPDKMAYRKMIVAKMRKCKEQQQRQQQEVGAVQTEQQRLAETAAIFSSTLTSTSTASSSISSSSFVHALNGLFVAVFNIETRAQMLPFFKAFIKHLIMQALLVDEEQINSNGTQQQQPADCHLYTLLVDAIAVTLSDSCKDYVHTAILAMRFLIETATTLFGKDLASQHPMFAYLVQKIAALCYRREWFARLGGCTAVKLILEYYPRQFVQANSITFLDACIEIISLSNELSSGAHDFASGTIDRLLKVCFQRSGREEQQQPTQPLDGTNSLLLEKFVVHLIDRIDDPEPNLREECTRIFSSISSLTNISLANLLQSAKGEVLLTKKIVDGLRQFPCLSISSKIALIDLYLFCSNIDDFQFSLPKGKCRMLATNLLALNQCTDAQLSERLVTTKGMAAPSAPSTTTTTTKVNGGGPIGVGGGGVGGANATTNLVVNAGNSQADVEKKILALRKASLNAFVLLYFDIAQEEFDSNDQILEEIFKQVVDTVLETENSTLREEANAGVAKIFNGLDLLESRQYIGHRLKQLCAEFRDRKQFISSAFFDKLTFLSKYSSRPMAAGDIQLLTNDLSLIMQTECSSLNIADFQCVTSAVQLFHIVNHREASLLKLLFEFMSKAIAIFSFQMQASWQQKVLPFFNASSTAFAKMMLTKEVFCDDNAAKFVQMLISVDEATQLRESLLQNLSALHTLIDELFTLELQIGDKFELNVLRFLATLFDKVEQQQHQSHQPHNQQQQSLNDDDGQAELFAAIRSLWASASFRERHTVRKILLQLPQDQQEDNEEKQPPAKKQQEGEKGTEKGAALEEEEERTLMMMESEQQQHTSSTDKKTGRTIPPPRQRLLDECRFDSPAYCARILLTRLRWLLNRALPPQPAAAQQRRGGADEEQRREVEAVQQQQPLQQQHQEDSSFCSSGQSTLLVEECVDLLYELTFAFVHTYASDFSFVRKFIETEVITKFPLAWRRATFLKVIKLLREDIKMGHSAHLFRWTHSVVTPLFAHAFEHHEPDAVIGAVPAPPSTGSEGSAAITTESSQHELDEDGQLQQQNIVALLCKEVIQRLTADRTMLSHSMTISMYLFCSLLVQNCPTHIYDPAKKQQGGQQQGSLRPFMLFGWPSLHQNFQGDLTEKYAGHYLIANIIDKFFINKTIILQVLNSLMQAHNQDNKDMIRKSLEILIPAVPKRMSDGYLQLQVMFKKVLVEECRNTAQIIHCLQIIVRHHKVFYNIRHKIAQLLIGSMQRLLTTQQLGFEVKRLLLDVCDVVIKWEQERQAFVAAAAAEEETVVQQQSVGQQQQQTEPTMIGGAAGGGEGGKSGGGAETEATSSTVQAQQPIPDLPMANSEDLHTQMDKLFLENIVVFLFRIAASLEQLSGTMGSASAFVEQNRRAILLLRTALKPSIFGNVVTIRTQILEKQLQLPNPEQFSAGNEQAINNQLQMVNVTLEVLSNLIHQQLNPQVLLDIFRPLQRALVHCMSYSNSQQVLRTTYGLVSKLLEKTRASATGLDDFELLNQHIARCIHDTFNNYASTLTSAPPMPIITLLRLMHSAQPAYLETVCLNPFVKLLQRLVREYVVVAVPINHGAAASTVDQQAQKLIGDLLAICLEVLCSRTKHFGPDAQRTIVQCVIVPLIEKNPVDKIVDNVIKIAAEIVQTEISPDPTAMEMSIAPSSMPAEMLGAQILIKIFTTMEQRLAQNGGELLRLFLHSILPLFENQEKLEGAVNLTKLQPAFYWGLCSSDRDLRNRYFTVFERNFPRELFARLLHIMSRQNWELLGGGGYFWLAHVVHLLLLAEGTAEQQEQQQKGDDGVVMTKCTALATLFEQQQKEIVISSPALEEAGEGGSNGRKPSDDTEQAALEVEADLAEQRPPVERKNSVESMEIDQQQAMMDERRMGRSSIIDERGSLERTSLDRTVSLERTSLERERPPSMMSMRSTTVSPTKMASGSRPTGGGDESLRTSFSEAVAAATGTAIPGEVGTGGVADESQMTMEQQLQQRTSPLERTLVDIQSSLVPIKNEANCAKLIATLVDILHMDPALCRKVFVELFPSLWTDFDAEEREQITQLATPFLTSATMSNNSSGSQRKQQHAGTVVACFMEAFSRCCPPIKLDPFVLNYVGSTHRCWHIALLQLEQMAKGIKFSTGDPALQNPLNPYEEKLEILDSLANLYKQLNEFDQYSSVWKRRAYFEKTVKCMAFYQQGDFIRARETAEKLLVHLNEKLAKAQSSTEHFVTPAIHTEFQAFEQCWINSCKQLNDWTALETYSNSEDVANPAVLMEAAWHLHDWELLKDSLVQVDAAANPQTFIKSTLYKLMLNIANFNQQEYRPNKEVTERLLMDINRALIADWKRLPSTVSHSHLELLNYTHLTHEVYESANVLHSNLQSVNFPSNNGSTNLNNSVKNIMKSWRNRSLTCVDQLSSWLDLFTWRSQFFYCIMQFYENTDQKAALPLPVHTLAQNQLQLAHALRRSNQIDLALGELNKLHSAILVHSLDVHCKLGEHIKCLLKLASGDASCTARKIASSQDALIEALDMVEGAQLQFLRKDQISRLMVSKGILLNKLDKREEAGRAFSAAAQLEHTDMLGGTASVWKHWGEFLSSLFLCNPIESSALSSGVQAIACTLEHVRMASSPQKARASVAKLLWLCKIACSSGASDKVVQAVDAQLEQYMDLIPLPNWLFWLNTLVADVQQRPGSIADVQQRPGSTAMLALLKQLARAYPQSVFHLLRVELGAQRTAERIQRAIEKQQQQQQSVIIIRGGGGSKTSSSSAMDTGEYDDGSSPADARLIAVLDHLCEHRLTDIDALDKMMNALDAFEIGPLEELLNEWKQILANCHFNQFTKIAELTTVNAEPLLLSRLDASIRAFKQKVAVGMDDSRQLEQEICSQILADFKFISTKSSAVPLHRVASALRKWIPKLCHHLRQALGPSHRNLNELSMYLSRFKCSMAQIDVFEGYFDTGVRLSQCNAQIAQFLPVYERCVRNEGNICRVVRMRSLNGKIYSYQLERVRYDHAKIHILQLFALLNTEFAKSRNTAQRLVQFAMPQVLFTGQHTRMLQCCPLAGISAQFQNANSDQSARNFVSFIDILHEMLNKQGEEEEGGKGKRTAASNENAPLLLSSSINSSRSSLDVVEHYYTRLAEQRYSHKAIHELFNQISTTTTTGSNNSKSTIAVPKDLFARWMASRYMDATSLWMARKKLAIHFALLGLCEHTFFLSSMTPDGLVLDLPTGQLFFADYKFDLTKKVCETLARKVRFIELDANRPVPFRLTSNIAHFLDASIEGHFTGVLTAVARSFNPKSLETWLRPILWDVFSKAAAAEEDPQQQQMNIANPVKRAVDTVLSRVKSISHFENGIGATNQLLMQAQLPDNLCRMDPSWHPWF